jgi:hypothetical protein
MFPIGSKPEVFLFPEQTSACARLWLRIEFVRLQPVHCSLIPGLSREH